MNDDENPSDPEEPKQVVDPRSWQERLKAQLMEDLIQDISDIAIDAAIERYRQDVIEHMVRSGELSKEKIGKNYRYTRPIWSGSKVDAIHGIEAQEISESAMDIPFPDKELYNHIIVDIWKRHSSDPTVTLEYIQGSNTIRRDKRRKEDSNGLTLNHHAIVYYYSCKAGYYDGSEEKKRINDYISNHRLEVTYDSFKVTASKFLRLQERFNSGLMGAVYPFIEECYPLALNEVHKDHESFRKLETPFREESQQ